MSELLDKKLTEKVNKIVVEVIIPSIIMHNIITKFSAYLCNSSVVDLDLVPIARPPCMLLS